MPTGSTYLMENDEEWLRLETKTDPKAFQAQAEWSGIRPGMRVLDAGCGPGLTTAILHRMVQPGGEALGVDYSPALIEYARAKYADTPGIRFETHDIREPLRESCSFDAVIVRFVLEYNLAESERIVNNLTPTLKKEGIISLIDLDYNCLSHYPLPPAMESHLVDLMHLLEEKFNFDPYAGRKLYACLYNAGYRNITVDMRAHHLIYGPPKDSDLFNWLKKAEVVTRKAEHLFKDYPGGRSGFFEAFRAFFNDPSRFTYTPVILCRGIRPQDAHPSVRRCRAHS